VERKTKSSNDQRVIVRGCLLLVGLVLIVTGMFSLLTKAVISPGLASIFILIWVTSILLGFIGVGMYVGYRTQSPGWLTGALPAIAIYGLAFLLGWHIAQSLDWIQVAGYVGAVISSMLGGLIGQHLRARLASKTH
jgi:hypothetical protein